MRLKNYVENTINEKVNKKEKRLALKNKNILVGAEFEFKLDTPLGNNYSEEYENAVKQFTEYNVAIDEYNRKMDAHYAETEEKKETADELQEELDELETYRDDMEAAISDWKDEIDNIKDDFSRGAWDAPGEQVYDKIITSAEKEINAIQSKIDENDKDLSGAEKDIEKLEIKLSDLEDDITNMEENSFEYVDYPDIYLEDYYEYMESVMGISTDEATPEYGEQLNVWPQEFESDTSDFADIIEYSEIIENAPFDDWEAGDYGEVKQNKGTTTWAVELDSSISGDDMSGIEVKSPPMPLPEFMEYLPAVLDWINDYGYTDHDTGFHIHMSLDNNADLDPLKLILFTEEDYIYKIFPDRINNTYVQSVKNKIKTSGKIQQSDLKKLNIEKKLALKFSTAHMDAINIRDIATSHVEFRYMGGNDYSNDENGITKTIASYSYWLSLANDPDFKRKEYIHKVSRILNKLELFQDMYAAAYIDLYIKKAKDDIDKVKLDVLKRKYQKQINIVTKYQKMDKKTADLLYDNKGFINNVHTDIMTKCQNMTKEIITTISSYDVKVVLDRNIK